MHRWTLAAILLLAACRYDQPGETASCTITLSGALTGSYDCRPAYVWWNPSVGDAAAFEFSMQATATRPRIDVSVGFNHAPSVGHFYASDSNAEGLILVTTADGTVYGMQVGPPTNLGPGTGAWDLNFDKVNGPFRRYDGYAYDATGTLDFSLQNGAVMAHVTF